MRPNLRLMQASQFLQQFKLDVCHKLGKEHIISDVLNRLASINTPNIDSYHLEFDTLSTYSTTLVELYPTLIS